MSTPDWLILHLKVEDVFFIWSCSSIKWWPCKRKTWTKQENQPQSQLQECSVQICNIVQKVWKVLLWFQLWTLQKTKTWCNEFTASESNLDLTIALRANWNKNITVASSPPNLFGSNRYTAWWTLPNWFLPFSVHGNGENYWRKKKICPWTYGWACDW